MTNDQWFFYLLGAALMQLACNILPWHGLRAVLGGAIVWALIFVAFYILCVPF